MESLKWSDRMVQKNQINTKTKPASEIEYRMPDDGNVSIESVVDTSSRMFLTVTLLTIAFVLQRHIMIRGANIFAAIVAFVGKLIGAIISI
jgi:hypothetical protein